jgi:hypothetical protein
MCECFFLVYILFCWRCSNWSVSNGWDPLSVLTRHKIITPIWDRYKSAHTVVFLSFNLSSTSCAPPAELAADEPLHVPDAGTWNLSAPRPTMPLAGGCRSRTFITGTFGENSAARHRRLLSVVRISARRGYCRVGGGPTLMRAPQRGPWTAGRPRARGRAR